VDADSFAVNACLAATSVALEFSWVPEQDTALSVRSLLESPGWHVFV